MGTVMKKGYMVQVISDDDVSGQYLEQDQKTISSAGYIWRSKSAAENSMRSFGKRLNGKHPGASLQIVEISDEPEKEKESVPETAEEEEPVLPGFEKIARTAGLWADMMGRLEDYRKAYTARLSEEDLRSQDLLHYIELNEVSEAEAVDLVRRLKESRIKRREAKDVLHLLDLMKGAQDEAQAVERALGRLDRRVYTVRVDETLPDVIGKEERPQEKPVQKARETKQDTEKTETDTGSPASKPSTGRSQRDLNDLVMRVYEDHQSGMNRAKMAAAYGVSVSTIGRYLKKAEQLQKQQDASGGGDVDELPF